MLTYRQQEKINPQTGRKEVSMAKTIRHSRQREKIYSYLVDATDHPTAEMIHTALKEEIPGLSLGTVYRNLNLLEELGKVRRVTALQGNERYDAICHDHAHFICQSCGSIRDLHGVDATKIQESISLDEGYSLSRLDMIVTGKCAQCAENAAVS